MVVFLNPIQLGLGRLDQRLVVGVGDLKDFDLGQKSVDVYWLKGRSLK